VVLLFESLRKPVLQLKYWTSEFLRAVHTPLPG